MPGAVRDARGRRRSVSLDPRAVAGWGARGEVSSVRADTTPVRTACVTLLEANRTWQDGGNDAFDPKRSSTGLIDLRAGAVESVIYADQDCLDVLANFYRWSEYQQIRHECRVETTEVHVVIFSEQ